MKLKWKTLPNSASRVVSEKRRFYQVRGAVQGVGFRPFVFKLAETLKLTGFVQNSLQGAVIEVQGSACALDQFESQLFSAKPPQVHYYGCETHELPPHLSETSFTIKDSQQEGTPEAYLMPDIATCELCVQEVLDPTNRRYGYPFTNCTHCGPRFTITEKLPYDRAHTTMKSFKMCAACQREYENPDDRRFHAQPNACPECGPELTLLNAEGKKTAAKESALTEACHRLKSGEVLAVKGLGGYHLMVDPSHKEAVQKLRALKQRKTKPFAVMFLNLEQIREVCEVSEKEKQLLRSPEAPIVLLKAKKNQAAQALLNAAAPEGLELGVMLPATPLHHLMLNELKRPLIATSANFSDELIAISEDEVLNRFKARIDGFLVHNRAILRHADDSMVREAAGREMLLRRARGYPLQLLELPEPAPMLLAVGGHLKNTLAGARGKQVYLSQHMGDLDNAQTMSGFQRAAQDFETLYHIKSPHFICDKHPDYLSSHYAHQQAADAHQVQHHYAHALACMTENNVTAPALAIVWDGTGLGDDGTLWGGEFLLIEENGYQRVGFLRPFLLPGGEAAIREPRRSALGLLYALKGSELFTEKNRALVDSLGFSAAELSVLQRMLERKLQTPETSSAGRLFDAVAALLGLVQINHYEAEAAMKLEALAREEAKTTPGEFNFSKKDASWILDWQPLVESLLEDLTAGRPQSELAADFHQTLTSMMVALAQKINLPKIVLSGGCFQNKILLESAIEKLSQAGFQTYWHRRVPPGDGGLALGQLMAAIKEKKICV